MNVKLIAHAVLIATVALSQNVAYAQNERAPDRSAAPPVYIPVDRQGVPYRIKWVWDEKIGYEITKEPLDETDIDRLNFEREVVFVDTDGRLSIKNPNESSPAADFAAGKNRQEVIQSESSGSCPLPSSFSIVANSSGQPIGNVSFLSTSRPPNVTTQWVTFDFYTTTYRGKRSHMPIVPFFREALHGWGAFIGDNHVSSLGCGSTALFNSQIEGWLQYDFAEPGPNDPPTNWLWQSQVFNGPNSCGNEMYDGYFGPYYAPRPKYRMELQASTGHWVAYRIQKYDTYGNLSTLTNWRSLDTDGGTWEYPPPWYDNNAEGVAIVATDSESGYGTWSINISNTSCGWF